MQNSRHLESFHLSRQFSLVRWNRKPTGRKPGLLSLLLNPLSIVVREQLQLENYDCWCR